MNGLESTSGRRSSRVESAEVNPDVRSAPRAVTAPEALPSAVAPGRPESGSRRISRRRLEQIDRDLSDREHAVLRSLQGFRFLTTRHLIALHFDSHATPDAGARVCRRVLQRLSDLRVIEHLERRVGGIRAGSASYVWRVGPAGDRLLRTAANNGARSRRREPSARHLDHCLAIASSYVDIVRAARAGTFELVRTEPEPACWRDYLGVSGARATLKPDLSVVTANGAYEDHWFIEVDCGTESLPTLIAKCRQYEAYRRTGRAQHDLGVFPLVVWLMPNGARAERLRTALGQARGLDAALFRILQSHKRLVDLVHGGAA